MVSFKIAVFCEHCPFFIEKGWNFSSEAKFPKCLMLSKHQISQYSIWHQDIFFFFLFFISPQIFTVKCLFERQNLFFNFCAIGHICLLGTQNHGALQSHFGVNFGKNYTCSVFSNWKRSQNGRISHEVISLISLLLWLGSNHHRENFPRRLFITFWIWKHFSVFNLQHVEIIRGKKHFRVFW